MTAPDWIPERLHPFAVSRSLQAGEILFCRQDRTSGLYVIERGEIRLSRTDAEGREVSLFTAGPGETFAEASLFSDVYHCDAVATQDTIVRLYPKSLLLKVFVEEPEVARDFMAALARQVMNLRTRLENRNLRTARERILHHLEGQAAGSERLVPIRGSLKQMASELGLTHESLYRTLAALEAEGTIIRAKGQIRLNTSPI